MRNLIFAINLTLDGCCDHTKCNPDGEVHDFFTDLIRDADLFVYGRKTYELMVPFWSDVAKNQNMTKPLNEFARVFDSKTKVVFSKTLNENFIGKNTKIVRNDLRDEILKLKKEQGKNILTGGVSIPSQLIELDLVDEYYFVIHPIVVGEGRRLLEGISLEKKLKLIESKNFKSGSVALRYSKSS